MVYSESGLTSVQNLAKPPTSWPMRPIKSQLLFASIRFVKIIRHNVDCLFSCHNKGEPSGSLKVPYIALQRCYKSRQQYAILFLIRLLQ